MGTSPLPPSSAPGPIRRLVHNVSDLIFSKPDELKAHAALIRSVLSWPVITLAFGLTIIAAFRTDVKLVLSHLGTLTVAGVTLTTQEQALNERTFVIQSSLAAQNIFIPVPGSPIAQTQEKTRQRNAESLSKVASTVEPRQSLIAVSKQLDDSIIEFLADSGYAKDIAPGDSERNVRRLAELGYVPKDIADTSSLFISLQKRLLEKKDATGLEFAALAQSGTTILQALNSLPRGHKIVVQPDVPIFADSEAKQRLPGVGVLLEEVVTGDHPQKTRQLFPTNQLAYYRAGMHVSWEWDFAQKWGETWYRDPNSSKMVRAFLGSANFVGRDLKELTK